MSPLLAVLPLACAALAQAPALPSPAELAELPPDGGPRFNRLVFEKSPYLLQHAANPVDWWPWCAQAFAEAARRDVPVFLSVGYSTCHWCHVMERESFADADVARLLNESFVCVKVDREERPDVDAAYMRVLQALSVSAGWPMTIVLAPDKSPLFAATYLPPAERLGRPGLRELVPALLDAWRNERTELLGRAGRLLELLRAPRTASGAPSLDGRLFAMARAALAASFDELHAGFGAELKFPTAHVLHLLLVLQARTSDDRAREMAVRTLEAIRRGGIWDHLGGGVHRYATDRRWRVPHFEKMLYDQALLAQAYLSAWQVTSRAELRAAAEECLAYVLRDLTSPEGAFFAAEDADSAGIEGLYYTWTRAELSTVLGRAEGDLFAEVYGVTQRGDLDGRSVLALSVPVAERARALRVDPARLEARLAAARAQLLVAREQRVRPLRDETILCDWNGLMIAAFARAGAACDEPRYAAAAVRAADFVLTRLCDEGGRLLHRFAGGQAALPATLDDHAFLLWGLIELYRATLDARWLAAALTLRDELVRRYRDPAGGFFLAEDAAGLPLRTKEIYDGALPSGNGVAAWCLRRLARLTGRAEDEALSDEVLHSFASEIAAAP
jgi:uncharacterized protein YyaL (SSP411 family)